MPDENGVAYHRGAQRGAQPDASQPATEVAASLLGLIAIGGRWVSDATATLSAGDLVGNYKILGQAGAGGMGVVYRALDMKLERTVALKFLPEHLVSSAEDKERFLREARTASSLDHPNIGAIHGLEETGHGCSFIVMAYYAGETLAEKIRRGPLPVGEAVDIAIQMGEGLAAAHAGTVVHRDIKPSNVILTQSGLAKVVDFGLARLTSSTGSTHSISTAGTIGYMSPEQTMGKLVDQRTDIWSLGIVLAEMLTGKNPFQRETAAATIFAILNEPPLPMDEVPIDLLRVIYRALSKDAAMRYQSCREMVADLKDFRSRLDTAIAAVPTGSQAASKTSSGTSTVTAAELRKQIEQATRPVWGTAAAAAPKWHRWALGAAGAAVVLAVLSFLPPVRDRVAAWFGGAEDHVAVLPFENVGNDPANEAVSAGLMDSLASRLTNLEVGKESLWVVPTSEVRRRKITDPASALRELGATVVVEGSLQRDGQIIHLTVNLVNTKTLRQIGSVPLEDRAGDFSTLEDEAVTRVAKLMHIEVTPEMLRATGGVVSAGAYESYLKALGYIQRYDKSGNLDLAIAALDSAVKADPRFALGFAELGEAYRMKYQRGKDTKWIDEALANCQKAQQLDDRLPVVYVTLGRIHQNTGKYDLALQEYQRALQLDPRSADAVSGLAKSYESAGRTSDAEAAYRQAIALRPDSWNGYNDLANFLDEHQRYDEAIAQYRHAMALTPDNAVLYSNLAGVYGDMGDQHYSEAEENYRKSIALEPSYEAYASLGYVYIQERKYAEAAEAEEKALQLNDKNYLVWGNLGIAYEGLNDKEKAGKARDREIALLEQAVQDTPRDAMMQSNLGLLYAKKKVREKAMSRMQSALALSPDDPAVLEAVGEAYESLGDRAQALRYIETSLLKGYSLADLKSIAPLQGLLSDPNFRPNGR
ncbi:MAG: tetratricopeptide repeat protein [Terriglobales bacterium]